MGDHDCKYKNNVPKDICCASPHRFYKEPRNSEQKNGKPVKNKKLFKLLDQYIPSDIETIQDHIAKHIEYNLGRTGLSMDLNVSYQAVAYSVRDRLLEGANDTRSHLLAVNPKRAYYFSMEYLPGRSLRNALLNLDLGENYKKALEELGYNLEDLYEEENDPGLGSGGLGRLASCLLDSLATHNFPVWGYGIRYNYGIFKQRIVNGAQCEVPDYWLIDGYPWEIRRSDVAYCVQFYGKIQKEHVDGKEKIVWKSDERVHALGFDQLVPGYGTINTVTLRLWQSKPTKEFDFDSFNHGDYYKALQDKQKAEFISSVLYPNDTTYEGKELRLKQQYFFVSASLQDILRRFRVTNEDWNLLPDKVAIQLNDTHPTLGIVELLRLLFDEEGLEFDYAWSLVNRIYSYTNHTVLPEALEVWPEDMLGKLLPRHIQLIHLINYKFLEEVKKKFPNDTQKQKEMSIIDEGPPKKVRMANLAIIGSHTVNGVAEIHTNLLKTTVFKNFYDMFPNKFRNITNGVTHRRWIGCANPDLAQFYTKELGTKDWFLNLELIKGLMKKIDDPDFRERWNDVKQKNKQRLLEWVKQASGVSLDEKTMFDVMIKRIHEYKRQLMNALFVVYRYLKLKEASPEERKKFVPRSVLIGGKAAPSYTTAKNIITLICKISKVINEDPDTNQYLKLVFLPNYSVTNAEVIIPGADLNQNISTVGTEASGTSNMKFCMNGAILLGTMDGANVEIAKEIGEENMISFGARLEDVGSIKDRIMKEGSDIGPELNKVLGAIEKGLFGESEEIKKLIEIVKDKNDSYLVANDFSSYIKAQEKADMFYQNREEWTKKSIITALNSSKFTSDRTIKDYTENIWEIQSVKIARPRTIIRDICKLDYNHYPNEKSKIGKKDSQNQKDPSNNNPRETETVEC